MEKSEQADGLAPPRRQGVDHALRVLRSRGPLILLCTLLATLLALAFSLRQQKVYSASAGLLFRDAQLDQKLFGTTTLPPSIDPSREAATNVNLLGLEAVAQRTATALGKITAGGVAGRISVSPEGQSNIVQVTATDHNPAFAAQIANTYAGEFINFRRDADRAKIAGAQTLVQTQLNRLDRRGQAGTVSGMALQTRAEELGILASLQTGNAELVQPATEPSTPSAPRTKRNVAIGFVLGLLLGVAAALLLERLDRRIKDVAELEEIYALPVLSDVPESQALGAEHPADVHGFAVTESFRMLRARLRYFNIDREIRSLMVTSVGPAEGKTTVAQNLAAAAASSGSTRVLLLEADLRRPRLAGNLGLTSAPGLAEVLTHSVGVPDVVQRLTLASGDGVRSEKTLDVMVAGITPPNPAELLESEKMADLLDRLTAIYDLVIIDTPPAGLIADAIPLMSRVGGVVIVSSVGRSTRDGAAHFRDQLVQLGAPLLGVIANRVKQRRGDRYYGGYGAYYVRDAVPGLTPPAPEEKPSRR
ncbi:MAG: polysaccharide biosynthesis tyrosine autokinase [Solirubrobacteraceae bacterium]